MATNPWVTLITASLGGLLTLVGAMITQHRARRREDARWRRECEREQIRWTHEDAVRSEERTKQRLADSYFEVLRLVEREAQWFEATTENWKVGAVNLDYQLDLPRVELPERTITDRSTIAAHLAAYGSTNVHTFYQTWRSTITSIEDVHHSWDGDWRVSGEPTSFDNIEYVQTVLHPKESAARRALGDAIAVEPGHR